MRIDAPLPARPEWERVSARRLFERVRRAPGPDDEIITAFRDGEVTLRTNRRVEGFTNAVQEIGYQGVRTGDLVIHSMDGFAGAIGVSDSNGKASPVVHCYLPGRETDPRYYAYLLRILAQREFITSLAKGIRERSTAFDAETFRSLVLPHPPLAEQRAIADYLDAETARIDALIAKKQQLIRLLDERRLAAIDDAIRSAGGPIVPVRRLSSRITSGPRGWAGFATDMGTPFIRITNIQRNRIDLDMSDTLLVSAPESAESDRTRVRPGDVLVSITADIGSVGCVPADLDGANISQHVALVRPDNCEPEWLAYAIRSTPARVQLDSGQYGGTKTQLSLDDIASLRVPYPERVAQRRVLDHLMASLDAIDGCVSRLRVQLELLAEHRQALITAAVTGEFAVPGAA